MEDQVTEDLESKVEEHRSFLLGMGNGKTKKRNQDQICISDRLYCLWCPEEIERQVSRQGGDLLGYIEILEGKYYYLDFSDAEAEFREVFGSKQRGLGLWII